MPHDIQEKLSAPFRDADLEWRLQWTDDEKGSGLAVPYVTNRAIQNRLDKTVGVDAWKNEFIPWHSDGKKASQICGISIYFAERKEWITKYDGAEDSDIEPIKGGLSDSMKRAAVQWGIGRYLYQMDAVFVDVEKRGRTTVIKKTAQVKLDEAHHNLVKRLFKSEQPQETPGSAPPKREPTKPPAPAAPVTKPPVSPMPPPPAQVIKHPAADMFPEQPTNSYCVVNAVLQPTAKGGYNTHLQLRSADGNVIQAFMQGENPAIAPGVWIINATVTEKQREGITFNTLDSYALAAQQAA